MISSAHRFQGRGSLTYAYRNGKVVRGTFITLRYCKNMRQPGYRAAVVVSKKVSTSAVVRNRIRRRIYERVRILSTMFQVSYDMIFLVYDARCATMPAVELDNSIRQLLLKSAAIPPDRSKYDIVNAKD